jgi:hypothetical protein
VSGRVELTADKEQSVACISVLFTGRCKVKLTQTERYTNNALVQAEIRNDEPVMLNSQMRIYTSRSRAYYFAYNSNLAENTVYQPGTYSWPFSFRVPNHAEQVSTATLSTLNLEADEFQSLPPWKGSGEPPQYHRLPESLEYSDHASGNLHVDEANIEYKLVSKLIHDKASYHLFSGNQEAMVDLTLRHPPEIANLGLEERSQDCIIKSLRVLPEHADGHLSFREKTHSLFHKADLPAVAFKVAISFPRAIPLPSKTGGISETLPFSISLTRVKVQSVSASGTSQLLGQDIPTPRVTLKKLRLRLVATTCVRDSGINQSAHSVAPEETFDLFDESMKCGAGRENIDIPSSGAWVDLGHELGISFQTLKEKHQYGLVPTFSTYNISRGYTLEFKVELSCVEEEMKFNCEDKQAVPVVLVRDERGARQPQASSYPYLQSPDQGGPQQSHMYMPQVQQPSYSPQPQSTLYQCPPTFYNPQQGSGVPQHSQQPGDFQPPPSYSYLQLAVSSNLQDNGSLYGRLDNQYPYQSPPQEDIYPSEGYIGGAK